MECVLDTRAYSTYSLHYHLVPVVKYRCVVFNGELSERFHEVVNGFADNYVAEIKNLEVDRDHDYLLFKATSATDLTKFVNGLKRASARRIHNKYRSQIEDKL